MDVAPPPFSPAEQPCPVCGLLVTPRPERRPSPLDAREDEILYESHDGPCGRDCRASRREDRPDKQHTGAGCPHCAQAGISPDMHRANGGVWARGGSA